jgi:hypothetical protein
MTTQVDKLEHLRARLSERDVAVEEVWDYLILNHQPLPGMQMQHLAQFIESEHLSHFWWLVDWWAPVPDKPPALAMPTIQQFCFNVNFTPGTKPVTFSDAIVNFYNRGVAHLQSVGMDPQNTGESKEERKRRENAERMRNTRGHRRVPDKKIKHDDILAGQVRGLEAERDRLKAEKATVVDKLTDEVKEFQARMMERSEARKATEAEYKARIDSINAEIRNLTQK